MTNTFNEEARNKILEFIGDRELLLQEIADGLGMTHAQVVNYLQSLRAENKILTKHVRVDNKRLLVLSLPKAHPLQDIFGHKVNFTDEQIKSTTKYNEKNAKHNLRFNVVTDSFGESAINSDGVLK